MHFLHHKDDGKDCQKGFIRRSCRKTYVLVFTYTSNIEVINVYYGNFNHIIYKSKK